MLIFSFVTQPYRHITQTNQYTCNQAHHRQINIPLPKGGKLNRNRRLVGKHKIRRVINAHQGAILIIGTGKHAIQIQRHKCQRSQQAHGGPVMSRAQRHLPRSNNVQPQCNQHGVIQKELIRQRLRKRLRRRHHVRRVNRRDRQRRDSA